MIPTDPSTRTGPVALPPSEGAQTGHTRTIMIVDGDERVVRLLDAVLESGRYDIAFVESAAHAYSQIKRLRPNLVVICMRLGETDGLQVLTMLRLDEQTRSIPVLACATDYEGRDTSSDQTAVEAGMEAFARAPAGRSN